MTNGGPGVKTKEEWVQEAVANCCRTYELPDKPSPDWDTTFPELGVSESEYNCIIAYLEQHITGFEGGHNYDEDTPQTLVDAIP